MVIKSLDPDWYSAKMPDPESMNPDPAILVLTPMYN
jgi:hypothetical protein